MSKILKCCTKGKLYTPAGDSWLVRVVNTEEHTTLYFKEYDGYGTQFGTRVDFFDDAMGILRTECEVIIREIIPAPDPASGEEDRRKKIDMEAQEGEHWVGRCKINDVTKITQRHLDVRADVNIPLTFTSDLAGEFEGTIVNISAGGIQLVTKQELEMGDVLFFTYAFRTLERPFSVRILHRREKDEMGIHYGCCFIGMTTGGELAVRGYVFKTLRNQANAEEIRRREEILKRDMEERLRRLRADALAQDPKYAEAVRRKQQSEAKAMGIDPAVVYPKSPDDVLRDAGVKSREGQGRAEDMKAHVKNQQARTTTVRTSNVQGIKRV